MPIFPPHSCAYPGCPNLVPFRGGDYCPAHTPKKDTSAPKRNDKVYQSRAWRNTSTSVRIYNPICQRLDDGRQCTRPAQVVHHLQDPSDAPDLVFDWANLVASCEQHHAGGTRGAHPDERWVWTLGPYGAVSKHGRWDGGPGIGYNSGGGNV